MEVQGSPLLGITNKASVISRQNNALRSRDIRNMNEEQKGGRESSPSITRMYPGRLLSSSKRSRGKNDKN
jgi:hypothetical protein